MGYAAGRNMCTSLYFTQDNQGRPLWEGDIWTKTRKRWKSEPGQIGRRIFLEAEEIAGGVRGRVEPHGGTVPQILEEQQGMNGEKVDEVREVGARDIG